nr:uncharacterized protein LOC104097191 isoform X1 [Nicotiana tomentosiformis]
MYFVFSWMTVVSERACVHLNYSIGYLLPPTSTIFRRYVLHHPTSEGQFHHLFAERGASVFIYEAYTCRLMEHGLLSPVSVKSPPPLISSKPESSKVPQQASKNADVKSKKRLKTDCN